MSEKTTSATEAKADKTTLIGDANVEKTTSVREVKEVTWIESFGSSLVGVTLMLVSLVGIYFSQFAMTHGIKLGARIGCAIGLLSGGGILALAIVRSLEAKRATGFPFPCPYCDVVSEYVAKPVDDFDCEHCNRTVHFVNGAPIPVRTIVCQACKTEHRVPSNLARYVCDKCNRPLKLVADKKVAIASNEAADAMLQNYNVELLGIDKRHEAELIAKIQSLMMLTLPEARRLVDAANPSSPLIVAYDLPQRKADAVRRSLQELGGTAAIKSTGNPPRK
jgi:ribosomal protein L7/L12